ncbi:FAD-dependent oxidoreductase [Nonomuraea pusilla]|uniref:FAD-dependent oxidoreductase n=1 Tax=Nonomuraea pusilla TaxID=46177 RepID=UPI0033281AB1
MPDVLGAIDGIDCFPHHRYRVPLVWGSGAVTLAGDAAHTMPPTMAQGANQALEDAWALARTVAAGPVPRLRAYERARARVARRSARPAATEATNLHRPAAGLVPDRLATMLYTAWLGRASTYLLTAP